MKVVVIGRAGQLAASIEERASDMPSVSFEFLDRNALDLNHDSIIEPTIAAKRPDVIVNAAAYTDVEKAEACPIAAQQINATAVALLARAARHSGSGLIHFSTDYVFDGNAPTPYDESAREAPLNVYGQTKLAGEQIVRAIVAEHVILRTSWLFSPFRRNFLKTILKLATNQPQLRIVGNQYGCPTSATDLADALLAVISRWRAGDGRSIYGTYHCAGADGTNWADFARHILRVSASLGGPSAHVVELVASERSSSVRRPPNSRLDSSKFRQAFAFSPRSYRDATASVVARCLIEGSGCGD